MKNEKTGLNKVVEGLEEMKNEIPSQPEKKPDRWDIECLCNFELETIIALSIILSNDFFTSITDGDASKRFCLNCLLNEKIEEFEGKLKKIIYPAASEAAG